jgi:hypothetical protein
MNENAVGDMVLRFVGMFLFALEENTAWKREAMVYNV